MLKQKRVNNKRKVIVSLSLVCLVFVAVITAVILINAFPNQAFESSIKVSYVAKDISAEVSAWYKEETGTKTYLTTTEGGTETVLKLKASGGDTAQELHMDKDITLTSSNKYVIFCYEFKNTGSKAFAGIHDFVNAIEGMNPKNMTITYSLDGTNYDTLNTGFSLNGNSEQAYYFKIEVSDLAYDADLNGSIIWDLGELKNNVTGESNETDPVRIGQTTYSTFEEAYNAAESGDIVIIKEDVTLSENFAVKDNVAIVAENKTSSGEVSASSNGDININSDYEIKISSKKFIIGANNGNKINLKANLTVEHNAELNISGVNLIQRANDIRAIYLHSSKLYMNNCNAENFTKSDSGPTVYGYACTAVIEGSTFKNNSTTGGNGGAIYFEESSINIINSHFEGNKAVGGGAALLSLINGTISGTTFKGNSATEHGGAIFYSYKNETYKSLNIVNSSLIENSANVAGGIFVAGGCFTISENSSILSNTATTIGGGIAANQNATIEVDGSEISSNTAGTHGGGIYTYSASINVKNLSLFNGNIAKNDGGGIAADGSTVTISNSTITENTSESRGGGIYASKATITNNCTILNNTAQNGGGIWSGELDINNYCTVNGNTATASGGGIYADNTATITNNCTISNNTSSSDGGGIYASKATITNNCTISNNTSSGYGGGIRAYTLTITNNCAISNNTATGNGGGICSGKLDINDYCTVNGNTATGSGGGIYSSIIATITNNCTISNNTSTTSSGGGIYAHSNATITNNCTISNNTSESYGGGIYVYSNATITNNCTISNNTSSGYGGGIYVYINATITNNCTVNENTATGNGGGIYLRSTNKDINLIDNVKITNNQAGGDGGGIFFDGENSLSYSRSSITINNATIATNSAQNGGGVYIANINMESTNSTIITGNTATNSGGGIYCEQCGAAKLENAIISSNSAANGGGGIYLIAGYASGGKKYTTTLNLKNTEINSNTAPVGGGMCLDNINIPYIKTQECVYTSNKAIVGGAIVIINSTTSRTLSLGGEFYGNYCENDGTVDDTNVKGGAIYVDGVDVEFTGSIYGGLDKTSKLNKNNAVNGGAICLENSSIFRMMGTATIKNCTARDYGGAVYSSVSVFGMLNESSVTSNSANIGGAAFVSGGTFGIMDSAVISSNVSTDIGGAICANNDATLYIESGEIKDNTSGTNGGAIFSQAGTVEVSNAIFKNNKASNEGGAIKINSADAANVSFNGTQFISNHADVVGGAIVLSGCATEGTGTSADSVNINAMFYGNSSGEEGGALVVDNGSVYFAGEIYGGVDKTAVPTDKNAKYGGGIIVTSSGKLTLSSESIIKNCKAEAGGALVSTGTCNFEGTISNCSANAAGGIISGGTMNLKGTIESCTSTETTVAYSIATIGTLNLYASFSADSDICMAGVSSWIGGTYGSINVKEDLGSKTYRITFGDVNLDTYQIGNIGTSSSVYSHFKDKPFLGSYNALISFDDASYLKLNASSESLNFYSNEGSIKKRDADNKLYIYG